jgi:hypothetical protein
MTTTKKNNHTTTLIFYGLLFILGFMLGCNLQCNKGKTEIKVIEIKDSVQHKPEPVNIEVIAPGRIPELAKSKPYIVRITDTLWIFEHGEIDTAAILQDYFAKVFYRDTISTKYGNVIILDTVTRNRIDWRKAILDFEIPSEVKYVTKEEKKRNQIYLSMGGLYNQYALSVGGGFTLKTKKDRMFGVRAYLGTGGKITYNFTTDLKIKLR